jgi:hypothetical protein
MSDPWPTALSAWPTRLPITCTPTRTLTDFQNTIWLPAAWIANIGSVLDANLNSLRVSDTAGNVIFHKIIRANTAGTSYLDVKLATTASVEQKMYLYYGNPGASAPSAADQAATYDGSFVAVWHLDETGNPAVDATINAITASSSGSGSLTFGTSGQIGNAVRFAGTNVLDATLNTVYDFNGPWAIEAIVKPDTLTGNQHIGGNYVATTGHGLFLTTDSASWKGYPKLTAISNGVTIFNVVQTSGFATGSYQHVAGVYNPSLATGNAKIYLNGSSMSVAVNKQTTFAVTSGWQVAGRGSAAGWNGGVDEYCVHKSARSPDWWAERAAQVGSNVRTAGTEESQGGGASLLTLRRLRLVFIGTES